MAENSNAKDIIIATSELVKAVPVYDDALKPAAKQIGQSLETVGKALNTALLPVKGLIWGFEQISEYVNKRVTEKLKTTPAEHIKAPDPAVAGPALEALRYTAQQENLREMYANLLVSAIDERTAENAHPGFVEILRNLSSEEALILKHFGEVGASAYPIINIKQIDLPTSSYIRLYRNLSLISGEAGCKHVGNTASYLENLARLGLIDISYEYYLSDLSAYNSLTSNESIKRIIAEKSKEPNKSAEIEKGRVELTLFGLQFIKACVVDRANE